VFSVTADARLLAPGRYDGMFIVSPIGNGFEFLASDRVMVHVEVTPRGPAPPPAGPPAVDLQSARPNPVSSATTVSYGIPETAPVRLAVYDARGREVALLAEGTREAGWHDAEWRTEGAAAGLYVVRLVASGEVQTVTVVVVR
jgi:hypothetical protein